MKKIKYLVTNGCSYSAGACMYTGDDEEVKKNQNKNRFSKKLSEKLNCEEINLARPGGSNDRIFRTTFDWIQENKEKVKDTLFIIGLTAFARVDLYDKKKNRYLPAQPFYSGESIKLIAEDLKCSTDEIWDWVNFKLNYTYDEKQAIKKVKRDCILLNNYVNGNIIFFNALHKVDIFINDLDFLTFEKIDKKYNSWKEYVGMEVGHPKENHHHEMAEILYKHIQKGYEENNT
jgi:hypothetical protein